MIIFVIILDMVLKFPSVANFEIFKKSDVDFFDTTFDKINLRYACIALVLSILYRDTLTTLEYK